jgi:acetoacetyl-CoA synthetase
VHGHGGTVLVAQGAEDPLHNDVGCSYHPNLGERFHWYSSTGWVMWNARPAACWAAPPA